jgi:hypothetical protein
MQEKPLHQPTEASVFLVLFVLTDTLDYIHCSLSYLPKKVGSSDWWDVGSVFLRKIAIISNCY